MKESIIGKILYTNQAKSNLSAGKSNDHSTQWIMHIIISGMKAKENQKSLVNLYILDLLQSS